MERYILVVDDDPMIVELLTTTLERAGYRVTSASDAWQEVLQTQGLKPALVITDIQMPGFGTGMDAYLELRKSPRTSQTPILFLTGIPQERAQTLLAGALRDPRVRLLYKPINWTLMEQAIQELTGAAKPLQGPPPQT